MWACACSAMASSSAGGMAWSAVPITAQDGMVCQAGTPEGWVSASEVRGRWVAASTRPGGGQAVGHAGWEYALLDVDVGRARGCAGIRLGGHVRGRQDARAGVGGDELADGLALGGREAVYVDQGLDLVVAGGGVGDDGAAIGVPDQDDGAGDGVEEVADEGGVIAEAEQRVGRHVDRVPVVLEQADDRVPAGAVRPRPVDEHDAGLESRRPWRSGRWRARRQPGRPGRAAPRRRWRGRRGGSFRTAWLAGISSVPPALVPGLQAVTRLVWPVQREFAASRMTSRTKPGWDSMATWLLSTS